MTAPALLFATLGRALGPQLAFPAAGGGPRSLTNPLVAAGLLARSVRLGWPGTGRIAGTVKVITVPAPSRIVRLYDRASGAFARETASDSLGAYAFDGIDSRRSYFVVAFDHQPGGYNAAIADSVVPA